jgi:hypothetical protein
VLLRLAYLGLTNTFALLRLLPMTDRDKDIEILALRHQIGIPHQSIANARPLQPLPSLITDQAQIACLDIHRRQRLGGILNEYHHAA